MKRELPDDEYLQLLARDDKDFRSRLIDWLQANGIDASQVPAGERPSLKDGRITLRMFTLDGDCRKQIDPVTDKVLAHTVTVPMTVEPGDFQVARWLTPPCPACGR